jgi:hypothetical protein
VAYSTCKHDTVSPLHITRAADFFPEEKRNTRIHRHNLVIYCPCENNTINIFYFQLRKAAKAVLWRIQKRDQDGGMYYKSPSVPTVFRIVIQKVVCVIAIKTFRPSYLAPTCSMVRSIYSYMRWCITWLCDSHFRTAIWNVDH